MPLFAGSSSVSDSAIGENMSHFKSRLTLIAAAAAFITTPAAAQGYRTDRPVIWTGFYGGANIGYGWGEMKSPGVSDAIKPGGIIGGLHAGYNYQMQNFVVGAEGDFDFSNAHKNANDGFTSATARFNSVSSVRARAGFAFDRTLVYGTFGYGWSSLSIKGTDGVTPFDYSKTFGGLVYGGGAEYKFTQNISMRAEVLRFNTFGNIDFGGGDVARINTPVTQFRMGLSYHF
jgi:outer membrane immunogenic protein